MAVHTADDDDVFGCVSPQGVLDGIWHCIASVPENLYILKNVMRFME